MGDEAVHHCLLLPANGTRTHQRRGLSPNVFWESRREGLPPRHPSSEELPGMAVGCYCSFPSVRLKQILGSIPPPPGTRG